jgi:hypothetical protein
MNDTTSSSRDVSPSDLVTALLHHLREHGDLAQGLRSAAPCHSNERNPGALASDILHGADEIAEFLYGHRKIRRKIYALVEAKSIPHFRLGANICGRKSVLLAWIARQEDW